MGPCSHFLDPNFLFIFKNVMGGDNIMRLLYCVSCNHIPHEHKSPLILELLVHGEHSCCEPWIFQQALVYYHRFWIATYFIGKRSSRSWVLMFKSVFLKLYTQATNLDQWSGRFLGMTGWDPRVCNPNRLHVDILRFSFTKLGYIP